MTITDYVAKNPLSYTLPGGRKGRDLFDEHWHPAFIAHVSYKKCSEALEEDLMKGTAKQIDKNNLVYNVMLNSTTEDAKEWVMRHSKDLNAFKAHNDLVSEFGGVRETDKRTLIKQRTEAIEKGPGITSPVLWYSKIQKADDRVVEAGGTTKDEDELFLMMETLMLGNDLYGEQDNLVKTMKKNMEEAKVM